MKHSPITTTREWHAFNRPVLLAFLLKSAVLVSMSLFIGAVFAWYA